MHVSHKGLNLIPLMLGQEVRAELCPDSYLASVRPPLLQEQLLSSDG